MNKLELIEYVSDFCKKNKIDFIISEGKQVKTVMAQEKCSGFFEHNHKINPTLGIAKDLDDDTFYEVLLHEFCHTHQYLENSQYWKSCRLTEEEALRYGNLLNKDLLGLETGDLFHFWLEKEIELPKNVLDDIVDRTTAVEFDCERRVLDLFNKLNINRDMKVYAQKANAYLYTYFYALNNRRWTTSGKSTYMVEDFFKHMPLNIDPEFCKKQDAKTVSFLEKYCL